MDGGAVGRTGSQHRRNLELKPRVHRRIERLHVLKQTKDRANTDARTIRNFLCRRLDVAFIKELIERIRDELTASFRTSEASVVRSLRFGALRHYLSQSVRT